MSKRKYSFEMRLAVVMHYFTTDEGYRFYIGLFHPAHLLLLEVAIESNGEAPIQVPPHRAIQRLGIKR